MSKSSLYQTICLSGIAIFSMFFGAGNVVFPLKIGLISGNQVIYALLGLLLTAIGGPLLGLASASLYRGDCLLFFRKAGNKLGLLFFATALALLGPFAVLPRCFVIAHASFKACFGPSSPLLFSLLFGGASLTCCLRKELILPLLGKLLSPLLLGCLISIIGFGLYEGGPLLEGELTAGEAFLLGLEEGFDTMDLLAALFSPPRSGLFF